MAGFLKWRLAAALILWVATIMAVAELRTDQSTGTVVAAFILGAVSVFLTYIYVKKG